MHRTIFRLERLTKKLLFSLDEGLVIAAGGCISDSVYCKESFLEQVAPLSDREAQWQRAKKNRADGRMAAVYKTFADYCEYREHFIKKNLERIEEPEPRTAYFE